MDDGLHAGDDGGDGAGVALDVGRCAEGVAGSGGCETGTTEGRGGGEAAWEATGVARGGLRVLVDASTHCMTVWASVCT